MPTYVIMALSWLYCCTVNASAVDSAPKPGTPEDSLTVSFVTCWPGPEIYELYGHEAIRIKGEGTDSIWNFGIFDFREPNFVYRFVKGDADYMVTGYPFEWFLPEYIRRGSRVEEQVLDLTAQEAESFLKRLQTVSLPQNRKYHYNYVRNNCATRIYDLLDSIIPGEAVYPDSIRFGTFRNEMRSYNKNYPWYQFGIDLVLGRGIDAPIDSREEMFVPIEMHRNVADASFPDGRKLVKATNVLNIGIQDTTLPSTPWYLGPVFWSIMCLFVAFGFAIIGLRKGNMNRFVITVWFLIAGLAGLLVAFLVFISEHEATSPNLLFIWLNPLQLVVAVAIWFKSLKPVAKTLMWYNAIALPLMCAAWPFQAQSTSLAAFPLIGTTWILATAYILTNSGHIGDKTTTAHSHCAKIKVFGTGQTNNKGGTK